MPITKAFVIALLKEKQITINADLNQLLELGDVGVFRNGTFTIIGNLGRMGIQYTQRTTSTVHTPIRHSSKDASIVETRSPSKLRQRDRTGFLCGFKRPNSFAYVADIHNVMEIDDIPTLQDHILEVYENDNWDPDWFVVTTVFSASFAVMLLNSGSGESQCSIDISKPVGSAVLGLGVTTNTSEYEGDIQHNTACTPHFKVHKLNAPWYPEPMFDDVVEEFDGYLSFTPSETYETFETLPRRTLVSLSARQLLGEIRAAV